MVKQETGRKQSHSEILHDLTDIKGKAQDVWDKIGEPTFPNFSLAFHIPFSLRLCFSDLIVICLQM